MNPQQDEENKRAYRISFRMTENHNLLSNIYENLVDRDFKAVEKDAKNLIVDLRYIIKSLEEDEF
jgi:hypothetical protein